MASQPHPPPTPAVRPLRRSSSRTRTYPLTAAQQSRSASVTPADEPAIGQAPPPSHQDAADGWLDAIEEAARDGDIDPVKFDRLVTTRERFVAREARIGFDTAFAGMQAELPVIPERGRIPDGSAGRASSYALWEDINEAIKPVLTRFGFALRFKVGQDHNTIVITAILSHQDGHAEETTMRLPVDLSGGKNGVQAIGSSTSYGKRYTATALLNVTSRGEDDDGRAADQSARITPEEAQELRQRIVAVKGDERRLCNYLGVTELEALPPSRLKRAIEAIAQKGGAR
jgi:hypothetical protein